MYCPNCGQQQISGEVRFCSRCGLALTGLMEWLAGGALPASRATETQSSAISPRRKGMRRAAKLMFFSGVLFPVFIALSLLIDEGAVMIFPFVFLFISIVMMLYARLFGDNTARVTSSLGSNSTRGPLPPPINIPITNELPQPRSVTEHTTRLLDRE
jgi:hypothetical protein